MNYKQRAQRVKDIVQRFVDIGWSPDHVYFLGAHAEDFADAIIGTTRPHGDHMYIVYDETKILKELKRMEKWDEAACLDWYEFNIASTAMQYPNILIVESEGI